MIIPDTSNQLLLIRFQWRSKTLPESRLKIQLQIIIIIKKKNLYKKGEGEHRLRYKIP